MATPNTFADKTGSVLLADLDENFESVDSSLTTLQTNIETVQTNLDNIDLTDIQGNTTVTGTLDVTSNLTVDGIVNINGGSGGTSLSLNNGGDLILNNGANTGSAALYCDTNNELRTNSNVYINSTGYLRLPTGTEAQKPSSPIVGQMRWNTSDPSLEVYTGSIWYKQIVKDGLTAATAVNYTDLQDLASYHTTNGNYYVTFGGAARQVYVAFASGTAWILAMRCHNNNTFQWSSAYWTNTSDLNRLGNPASAINIKDGQVWQHYPMSNMRLNGFTSDSNFNNTTGQIIFGGWGGVSLYTVFNGGNNTYDSVVNAGRAAWLAWSTAATGGTNAQGNCNVDRINWDGNYRDVRIGMQFNNENDCNTNDTQCGFGSSEGYGCGRTGLAGRGGIWVN